MQTVYCSRLTPLSHERAVFVKEHHLLTQVHHQETDRARNGFVGLAFDWPRRPLCVECKELWRGGECILDYGRGECCPARSVDPVVCPLTAERSSGIR